MAKKRLIPKLQIKTSSRNKNKLVLVVTKQFNHIIEIGDPISQAKIYQAQNTDELIFLNIEREDKDIGKLCEVIAGVSEEIFMPLTVGGGVKSVNDFRLLLSNGADKISINSIALKTPEFIKITADKFGSQCVVVSIDFKKNSKGVYKVYTNNGANETQYDPIEWAQKCELFGAGEILLTSIERDGMRNGLDVEMTHNITQVTNIPVITSGGCGLANHFSEAFIEGKADAVSAGSFFVHRDQNFMQTRAQIKNANVDIRMLT